MRGMYGKLTKDKKVVEANRTEFSEMYLEREKRIVKQDTIDGHFISTVFLGLNHSFGFGKDQWFESMIFDKDGNELDQMRYSTWSQALKGHERMVKSKERETGAIAKPPSIEELVRYGYRKLIT